MMTIQYRDRHAAKMRLKNAGLTRRRLMHRDNFRGRAHQLSQLQRSLELDARFLGASSVRWMVRNGQLPEEFVGGAL